MLRRDLLQPSYYYYGVGNKESQPVELQLFEELTAVLEGFLGRRGMEENWLIGKGVLLQAPFSYRVTEQETHYLVEVSGYFKNVPVTETIRCRRAVTGRFRSQITFLDVVEGALDFRRLAPLRPLHTKLLSGVALGSSISAALFQRWNLINLRLPLARGTSR